MGNIRQLHLDCLGHQADSKLLELAMTGIHMSSLRRYECAFVWAVVAEDTSMPGVLLEGPWHRMESLQCLLSLAYGSVVRLFNSAFQRDVSEQLGHIGNLG